MSGETFEKCPQCGWDVSEEILAETPDCPHGWASFDGMSVADIKAEFAAGAPDVSIDPAGEQRE
jgi:hypothetical protein